MNLDGMPKLDGRRLIKESGDLFLNDYYQSFLPGFTDLIKQSKDRIWYKDPVKHYGLQIALLETLQGLERASSEGKKLSREQSSAELDMQSKRNKFLAKAVKEISDGVAWRTLGYSRFKMRILSQGRYSGHTWGKDGQLAELKHARRIVGNGGYVLINDVTNCLRIGDLTLIHPDKRGKCYLVEIKKNEIITAYSILNKLDSGKKLDKQEKRLFQAQIAIDENKFPASFGKIPFEGINIPLHDVISSVSAITKQALKKGAAFRMITSYMRVEAIDLPALFQRNDFKTVIDDLGYPDVTPFFEYSSYDHLMVGAIGEVERGSPPYTIFPLPTEVIVKIITGELYVKCSLYEEPLKAAFKSQGWELLINKDALRQYTPPTDEENVTHMSSELLFPKSGYEALPGPMKLKNPNGFSLPAFELISQMTREYLTVQHVVAVAQEIMKRATRGEAKYTFPEVNDKRRWN